MRCETRVYEDGAKCFVLSDITWKDRFMIIICGFLGRKDIVFEMEEANAVQE